MRENDMAGAMAIVPWLAAQGSRFKKVPALLYIWLTLVGPIIILMLYGVIIPIWYSTLFTYTTGAIVLVVALQSSGATVSDPEYTKESGMLYETAKMLTTAMETLKDIIDDKKK